MKIKLISSLVLSLALLVFASPVYAIPPALPHAFYGNVEINGYPAPDGTQIEAAVDAGDIVHVQNPVSTVGGKYGNPYLLVQGSIQDGAVITFHVTNANGTAVGGTDVFKIGGGPDRIDLSVDIAAPTPPPPAAGGGGLPAPPPGTTNVRGIVSLAGVFLRPVPAISEDGLCTLTIPAGTIGLTEELEPLTIITMLIMDEPPPPPEASHVIGLAYDFQPSGATFEPPITLTFKYDPSDIPEGIAEGDLVLAFYDEATGEWVNLECTVDPETNTITALISHFTEFAILGYEVVPEAAAFTPSSLVISPTEVDIGETINVSLSVANTGGMAGSYKVTLKIDDEVEAAQQVTVGAGASETVTFTTSRDVAGSYSVDVNGLSGSFTVKEEVAPAPPAPPPPAPPPEVKAPMNWPVVGGIIAAAIVAGLAIFFLIRRRRAL